jgi:hypothetical protein
LYTREADVAAHKLRKLVFSAQDWENVKSQVQVLFPRAEIVRANLSRP